MGHSAMEVDTMHYHLIEFIGCFCIYLFSLSISKLYIMK